MRKIAAQRSSLRDMAALLIWGGGARQSVGTTLLDPFYS
jgi:hypothetical protein